MRLLLLFLTAAVLALASANLRGDPKPKLHIEQGTALEFIDGLIRKLSKNDVSVLGPNFRDENGQLLKLNHEFTDSDAEAEQKASSASASASSHKETSNPKPDVQSEVHPDAAAAAAAAPAAPEPCTGATATTVAIIKANTGTAGKNQADLSWNYSPDPSKFICTDYSTCVSTITSSLTTMQKVCVYIKTSLSNIGINSNDAGTGASTASLALPADSTYTGTVSCENCYASFGAVLTIKLICDAGALTCAFDFTVGGGFQYNLKLQFKDIVVTADTPVKTLYQAAAPMTVFFDPSTTITVKAQPSIMAQMKGKISSTGTVALGMGFKTQAALGTHFDVTATAATVTTGFTGTAELFPPTITGGLVIANDFNWNVNVYPNIDWVISLGDFVKTSTSMSGSAIIAKVSTPIIGTYTYAKAGASSTSSTLLATSATLTNIVSYLGLLAKLVDDVSTWVPCSTVSELAALCFTANGYDTKYPIYAGTTPSAAVTAYTSPSGGSQKLTEPSTGGDPAPVAAPADAPTAKATCFASSETVTMESGEAKALSAVELGDRILTANMDGSLKGFSEVIAIPHADAQAKTTFARITTQGGKDIKMTPSHLVLAGDCNANLSLVQAGSVAAGQCMQTVDGQDQVLSNTETQSVGMRSVVTKAGDLIVVNGVVASPFAVNHWLAEAWYTIHRGAFTVFPALLANKLFTATSESFGELAVEASF